MEIQQRIELFKQGYWEVPDNLDTTEFDFNWRPDPYDRPYIHQFGTQWQKTGGPRFVIPENEGVKFHASQHAIRLPNREDRSWRPLRSNVSMDYSWHPDDSDPPYIYVFGNQWYDVDTMPTIQYRVKGATEKKFITDIKAELLPNLANWITPDDIVESTFDYSWEPHPHEPPYIWQFGTQHQKNGGPAYVAQDATVRKYSDILKATVKSNPEKRNWRPLVANIDFDWSWHPDEDEPPYIYVFGNQHYDHDLMPTLLYRVKGATEKKYMDLKATLLPNPNKFEVLVDDEIEFDYSWVPDPRDPPMNYVFGNQWHDCVTMPTVRYINNDTAVVKYIDEVKATIESNPRKFRIIEPVANFDYSWRPDPNDPAYNYMFGNEYHTTEFMPTVMYRVRGAAETKYSDEVKAELAIEKVTFEDSIFDAVMAHDFQTKYVHFQNTQHHLDYKMCIPKYDPEREYAHLYENCAIVPNGIKTHLFDKLTDYPYVVTDKLCGYQKPLDIIFISNGEECAEDNYTHLVSLNLPNRIVRVTNVNGRVASQYAAATQSETPWYFLINAKLRVNEDFDFNWQPDIMKSRRHYIFRAKNPINGLEYGHMAMVANNKKLTLATTGTGLDFTMESPHEIVHLLSGTAVFTNAWDTWRTAFRECIKLRHSKDKESSKRLTIWTNMQEGEFSEYSIKGARDAVAFYDEVDGDFDKIKQSYDWAWLYDRFAK